MTTKIENARISGTMLGYEDHGILTCFVYLEGEGWGVGFGGYGLDSWDEAAKKRWATNGYGLEFIRAILDVVGVEKWEDLKGKPVRVETEGFGGQARRLGHFMKDKWFDPKQLSEQFKQQETAASRG